MRHDENARTKTSQPAQTRDNTATRTMVFFSIANIQFAELDMALVISFCKSSACAIHELAVCIYLSETYQRTKSNIVKWASKHSETTP